MKLRSLIQEASPSWQSARDKGLDLSKQARLQRAQAMGFNTSEIVYHGTPQMGYFISGFDPKYKATGNDQYGSGYYLTTDPSEADRYTAPNELGSGAQGILPLFVKLENPIVMDFDTQQNLFDADIVLTHEQAYKIMKYSPDIYDMEDTPIGNFIDVWSAGGVEDWMIKDVASNYTEERGLQMLDNDFFRYHDHQFHVAVRDVLGFDSVIVEFGHKRHYVLWFAENIRSVNAVFDPDKADSTNLMD